MPNNKPQDVRLEARDMEIWRLYTRDSLSQSRIAERLGMTQSVVSAILARVRESIPQSTKEERIQRRLELLDEIMADLRASAPDDPAAARAVLAAMEREAKLLGLDAPAKQQVEQRVVRYVIDDESGPDDD